MNTKPEKELIINELQSFNFEVHELSDSQNVEIENFFGHINTVFELESLTLHNLEKYAENFSEEREVKRRREDEGYSSKYTIYQTYFDVIEYKEKLKGVVKNIKERILSDYLKA